MSVRRHRWLAVGGALVLALAGCADPQLASLDRELATIRANPGMPEPLALPEVPRYEPTPYTEGDRRSPFRPQLPEPEATPQGDDGVAPDADRPREPLEDYSLEELELVGVLSMGGQSNALIKAPDGEVHRLQIGRHMGRDHGRIVSITGSSVQLVELVPTGGGGWVERNTRIALDND
ncbi:MULTISPECIES: pilus assembly protein PilP [Halomonas]|uniref:Pilus assembly protein, PilP n=1 Tax=Halomonas chromatireducens TaxID=507626 RepID=A0A0X8HG27_9GAMM|nr:MULTISPECIES: pilus assembly protein PilP [Halomonas]AMD01978.1 Pilus assembly protein, PilP [Halomonas chromatireducens]MBZ0330145.1 pilus assembly protein PilP [Halomonas sp. ANAO-440]